MSLPNNNNDFVAIDISNSNTSNLKNHYCNRCNRSLIVLDHDVGELFCTACHVSYFPKKEPVKRANRFDTPGPETDVHGNITGEKGPLVAMVDDTAATTKPKASKLPPFIKTLKERTGVNVTEFHSTVDDEAL